MISIQKFIVGLAGVLILNCTVIPLARADTESPWKTFSIKAGGYFPIQDTNVRVDGTGGIGLGTEIDLEKDLGLDEEVFSYRIDAHWRFFSRHSLNFSFFDLSRDATTRVSRDMTIGDETFTIGTNIFSEWNYKVYAASYTWTFLQTNKYEVGLNIGAHITDIELGIEALGGIVASELDAVTLPLPVFGLTGAYAFTPKLVLRSNVGAFYIEIDEFKGSLINFDLDLEYNMWKYMGFGIGYNYFGLNIDVEADKFHGSVEYRYHGFKAFVRFYL